MVLRRIRVSFFDPDATDSDSGDDASHVPPSRAAIMVGNICSTGTSPARDSTETKAAPLPPPPPPPRMRGAKAARLTTPRFRGVYERQPGRWAADYRSHRPKIRQWLGTFASEAEAKAAYDAFVAHLPRRGASVVVEGVKLSPPAHRSPASTATATRSGVLDGSDQSERSGLNNQADDAHSSTVSSAPCCKSSLTLSTPPLDADERQMEDPFLALAELVAHDGLADLADLPLPSLDDKLDFGSGDWSMLNTDRVDGSGPSSISYECTP